MILAECCSALWKLETSWNTEHQSDSATKQETVVNLQELLLTPNLEASQHRGPLSDQRLQMKELFTK